MIKLLLFWTRMIHSGLIFALLLGSVQITHAADDMLRVHPALWQLAQEHPSEKFKVIVQWKASVDIQAQALTRMGGTTTKELPIIHGLAMELPGAAVAALARNPAVRWVSLDAPLFSTAVQDKFNAVAENRTNSVQGKAGQLMQAAGNAFIVNNTGDGVDANIGNGICQTSTQGQCTLRAAIQEANALVGVNTILFNIPGTGPHTITLANTLPTITSPVIIDGTSEPDYKGVNPVIEINGNRLASNGFRIDSGSTTIKGLVINRFSDSGIRIQSNGGNIIQGNYIGTDITGVLDLGNDSNGIRIETGNNLIGGMSVGEGNIVAGNNNYGIFLREATATGNQILGNWIGTNKTGAVNIGNSKTGIRFYLGPANNRIGGTAVGAGNVIAFNGEDGINFDITAGGGNSILGNIIYTNNNLAIDFLDNGVTANNGAKDTALPNQEMDYPVITSATLVGCWLTVTGYVGSSPNQNIFANARIEFFKANNDSSGYGEGQMLLGYLTTDGNGAFSGTLSGIGFNLGDHLTATATDSNNNTSEFGPNFPVTTNTGSCVTSPFTEAVHAHALWQRTPALKGQGITVAVVDSGISSHNDLTASSGGSRILAINNQTNEGDGNDNYVHGTHVAGIIGGNGNSSSGTRMGVAPDVNLVNVKVSNSQGIALASDLIDGLRWIYNNKNAYNIRVVNISMNSTVPEPYHTSAIDAAVEILWFNGIVVVVAAGNNGTGAGPVPLYPPANDPFVITVGAVDDGGTPTINDDLVSIFSAYGMTEDNYAKPDLVAPGRNIISLLAGLNAYGYINHPAHWVDNAYFRMSGTSMAAPVVSGAVALLLQDEPTLTPDQVKHRLKATANSIWPGYDPSKTGAGYLDIEAAVQGTTTQAANTGIAASQMLFTGTDPVAWDSVNWNSVNWNSVNWNSVNWNSVNWNSVNWNAAIWNSSLWDDAPALLSIENRPTEGAELSTDTSAGLVNKFFLPLMINNSTEQQTFSTQP